MSFYSPENSDGVSAPEVSRRNFMTNGLKAATVVALSGCMQQAGLQQENKDGLPVEKSEGFYDDWIRLHTKYAEEHQRLVGERNRLTESGEISQVDMERFNREAAAYNKERTERNVHWGKKHLDIAGPKSCEPLPEIELL
jgi:hypothetical protein